ncbi:unnamed protein product [Amoebophrya sp. A25]|nr:unnamed protein product [Amoebophrya sp. A25]|eukprot:GSA25T00009432001.1
MLVDVDEDAEQRGPAGCATSAAASRPDLEDHKATVVDGSSQIDKALQQLKEATATAVVVHHQDASGGRLQIAPDEAANRTRASSPHLHVIVPAGAGAAREHKKELHFARGEELENYSYEAASSSKDCQAEHLYVALYTSDDGKTKIDFFNPNMVGSECESSTSADFQEGDPCPSNSEGTATAGDPLEQPVADGVGRLIARRIRPSLYFQCSRDLRVSSTGSLIW